MSTLAIQQLVLTAFALLPVAFVLLDRMINNKVSPSRDNDDS